MTTKAHILEYLSTLKPLLAREGIERLGLFGSFAREEGVLGSDIDIVIRTTPQFIQKHPAFEAVSYLEALRRNISAKFGGIRVDICDESGLSTQKAAKILKGACYV